MKKATKIFLWILILFSILFGTLYFVSQPLLKKILDEELEDVKISGLYKLEVKKAYFDLFNLGISLKEIELKPDSNADLFSMSPQIAHLKIKRISLSYVSLLDYINEQKIHVGKLKIIDPHLDVYFLDRPKPETKNEINPKEKMETPLHIDGVELKNMQIHLHLKNGSILNIEKTNLSIQKPKINPELLPQFLKAFEYKSLQLDLKKISLINDQSLYHIYIDEISTNNPFESIQLNNLEIKPKLDKSEFARQHKYQSDRFDIKLKLLEITQIDIKRLLEKQILAINEIHLSNLDLEVFRDKSYPFNNNKFPKLPQQQIREIKQALEIEKISIDKTHIIYLEKIPDAKKAGRIEFKDLSAEITHFGNTENWKQNEELKINAQTRIYGETPLSVQMNFPLGSNTFYVSGQVKKSQMHYFNKIITPNVEVKIEDGTINKLDFSFKANKQIASGEMTFLYDDLEIKMLKEKETGEIKGRKFINFLVNNLVLPKENPNKKGEEYHGMIDFTRDPNKGFFHYLWKSVFSGIKDTFVKDNKELQEYTIEKEEAKQSRKEQRKQRKAERKKKRQENK